MSFPDETEDEESYINQGYVLDHSVLGRVYYPKDGVEQDGAIGIRYEDLPWISTFYVDGLRAV